MNGNRRLTGEVAGVAGLGWEDRASNPRPQFFLPPNPLLPEIDLSLSERLSGSSCYFICWQLKK